MMQTAPDAAIAEMATELAEGTRHLAEAFAARGRRRSADATLAADRATKSQSPLEHVYREAMSGLIVVNDLREVAERVWYAVLKQS